MSKIPTVFVIAPNGSKITRQTDRTYSHAIVYFRESTSSFEAVHWCGRPDLAAKALRDVQARHPQAVMIPVQV